MSVTSLRLASLPLPPRAVPVRKRKPIGRAAAARALCIDKSAAVQVVNESGSLPRISDMPFDCTVLVIGDGVPAFKVQHVSAALRARGISGYWLVEKQSRPRAGTLAETLVGFPGLHIERIGAPTER